MVLRWGGLARWDRWFLAPDPRSLASYILVYGCHSACYCYFAASPVHFKPDAMTHRQNRATRLLFDFPSRAPSPHHLMHRFVSCIYISRVCSTVDCLSTHPGWLTIEHLSQHNLENMLWQWPGQRNKRHYEDENGNFIKYLDNLKADWLVRSQHPVLAIVIEPGTAALYTGIHLFHGAETLEKNA